LEIEFGTALHVAASCGHLEVCKLILHDKNPADYQEWTPLHSAAMSGQVEVFEFLMEAVGVENVFKLDNVFRKKHLYKLPKFYFNQKK
jgi:ankyrin repeat protein